MSFFGNQGNQNMFPQGMNPFMLAQMGNKSTDIQSLMQSNPDFMNLFNQQQQQQQQQQSGQQKSGQNPAQISKDQGQSGDPTKKIKTNQQGGQNQNPFFGGMMGQQGGDFSQQMMALQALQQQNQQGNKQSGSTANNNTSSGNNNNSSSNNNNSQNPFSQAQNMQSMMGMFGGNNSTKQEATNQSGSEVLQFPIPAFGGSSNSNDQQRALSQMAAMMGVPQSQMNDPNFMAMLTGGGNQSNSSPFSGSSNMFKGMDSSNLSGFPGNMGQNSDFMKQLFGQQNSSMMQNPFMNFNPFMNNQQMGSSGFPNMSNFGSMQGMGQNSMYGGQNFMDMLKKAQGGGSQDMQSAYAQMLKNMQGGQNQTQESPKEKQNDMASAFGNFMTPQMMQQQLAQMQSGSNQQSSQSQSAGQMSQQALLQMLQQNPSLAFTNPQIQQQLAQMSQGQTDGQNRTPTHNTKIEANDSKKQNDSKNGNNQGFPNIPGFTNIAPGMGLDIQKQFMQQFENKQGGTTPGSQIKGKDQNSAQNMFQGFQQKNAQQGGANQWPNFQQQQQHSQSQSKPSMQTSQQKAPEVPKQEAISKSQPKPIQQKPSVTQVKAENLTSSANQTPSMAKQKSKPEQIKPEKKQPEPKPVVQHQHQSALTKRTAAKMTRSQEKINPVIEPVVQKNPYATTKRTAKLAQKQKEQEDIVIGRAIGFEEANLMAQQGAGKRKSNRNMQIPQVDSPVNFPERIERKGDKFHIVKATEEEKAISGTGDDSKYVIDLHVNDTNKETVVQTMVGRRFQAKIPWFTMNYEQEDYRKKPLKKVWTPNEMSGAQIEDYFNMLDRKIGEKITNQEKALKLLQSFGMDVDKLKDNIKKHPMHYKNMFRINGYQGMLRQRGAV